MAKMFYTLDEAKATLSKNEEEIKQLAREGRLREFRDGPRLMFKADQVEALKTELLAAGGSPPDLGPSDSGVAIGLADSHPAGGVVDGGPGGGISGSGLGSGLTLSDSGAPHGPGTGMLKEDTALAADLGLSGSVGGVPSPARVAGSGSGSGISTGQGSRPGVDVFQNDDVERVDPAAQTAISAAHELAGADSVGSGSGLLDLTRESDDTSLGAELLDEIAPSASGTGAAHRPPEESTAGAAAGGVVKIRDIAGGGSGRVVSSGAIIYEERADPMAPAFGAAALAATLLVVFGAFALITGLLDTGPQIIDQVCKYGFLGVAAGGLVLTLVFFLIGMVIGKSTVR